MTNVNHEHTNAINEPEVLPAVSTQHVIHVEPCSKTPIQMMAEANSKYRVTGEFYENGKKEYRKSAIANMQNKLNFHFIIPLSRPICMPSLTWNLPPSLVKTANALSQHMCCCRTGSEKKQMAHLFFHICI